VENLEGWGGYSFLQKMENPGKRGVLSEIPEGWGGQKPRKIQRRGGLNG